MPIFSRNPLMLAGEDIKPESTSGEVFGALFGEAMESGLIGATTRLDQLDQAEFGGSLNLFGVRVASMDRAGQRRFRPSPLLTPEQGRQKLRDNGLDQSLSIPQQGIRQATLDILMDRKREELRRQTILSQSSGGAGVFAGLAGSLVGSLVDPTNIALAFVPVVGQARYAAWLGKAGGALGRTGVRVGVGAAEGLVGLAPVEALNYYARQREQADYDAYDSMVAIAGGAFFGSALHAGAGLLGDLIRPPVRQPPPSAAGGRIAPAAGAEPPAPLLEPPALSREARERAYVMDRLAEGKPVTRAQASAERQAMMPRTGAEAGAIIDGRLAALQREANDGLLLPDQVKALVKESDELEALVREQDRLARQGVLVAAERRLTPQERDFADARRASIKQQLEAHKRAQGAATALNKLQTKLGKIDADSDLIRLADELMPRTDAEQFVESLSPAIRKALDADPFMPVRPFIAQSSPQTQQAAARMAIAQATRGEPVSVEGAFFTDPRSFDPQAALGAVRANAGRVDGADPELAAWGDTVEILPDDVESLRTLADEARAMLDDQLRATGLEMDEGVAEMLAEIDTVAKSQSEAAKVAAMCMMRNG